jgi:alkaline phosphatase
MKKIVLFVAFFIAVASCKTSKPEAVTSTNTIRPEARPKNIILMIGDGMGLTQITAGMYSNNNYLHLEEFPIVGIHKSYSAEDLITDSAAGATAFACGKKTYNAGIGVNTDTVALVTILEEAEARGMASGLIATCSVTHATPASFIAHVSHRNKMEDIATFYLKTEIDFFVGGGKKYFDRRSQDSRNLYQELEAKGYQISDFVKEDLSNIKANNSKNFAYFTADEEPLPRTQGRDYLPLACEKGISHLDARSGEKGFFLMVEGSQIDWGGHANDSKYIISEMLDFNEAIGKVLEFAKKDGQTLVIVTADHETGGYAINPGSSMDTIVGAFTSSYHTAALIPVFAYGPGAELFGGIYENTAIHTRMKAALGLE